MPTIMKLIVILAVSLAPAISNALRVPFLNRRAVSVSASVSPILSSTSTVAAVRPFQELMSSLPLPPSPLFTATSTTTSTTTSFALDKTATTNTATTNTATEIASGMDLMCLTNTVQHVLTAAAAAATTTTDEQSDEDDIAMLESLQNSLIEQRNMMTNRIAHIDHILPTLQHRPTLLESSLRHSSLQTATISVHMNHNVVATHWDALSHMDYRCVMNQIRTTGVPTKAAQQQQAIIINTLQQERTIAMARISLIDDIHWNHFLSTTSLSNNNHDHDHEDTISNINNHDDHDHKDIHNAAHVKSLMESIGHVLTMEREALVLTTSTDTKTADGVSV